MIRIALSSIITLCAAASIAIAADTTPYLVIAMLVLSGAVAGAFITYAADGVK